MCAYIRRFISQPFRTSLAMRTCRLSFMFMLIFGLCTSPGIVSPASAQLLGDACSYDLFDKQFVSDAFELAEIQMIAQFGGQTDCRVALTLSRDVQGLLSRYENAFQFGASSKDQECIRSEYEAIRANSGLYVDYRVSANGDVSIREYGPLGTTPYEGEATLELLKSGKLPYRNVSLSEMSRYDDTKLLSDLLEACHYRFVTLPQQQADENPGAEATARQLAQCVNLPPDTPVEDLSGWFIQLSIDYSGGVRSAQALAPNDALWRAVQRALHRCGPYEQLLGQRDVSIDAGIVFEQHR